ncbi:hypothetical protein QTH87_23510 [Variovorax sp. J22P168]|uniref:hypothetical protein n=1 Tax=Variovorax jilinensis TaxID=3053513 RepID=UPI0025777F19|nr:hypothetical protein [Variovorax sp. J22P168]MDM0015431.1 hypothetical protein [Variovorax sp. J22P168]
MRLQDLDDTKTVGLQEQLVSDHAAHLNHVIATALTRQHERRILIPGFRSFAD